MSTAVLDRKDTDLLIQALESMLENDAVCMYRRASWQTDKTTFECGQAAAWAGTCRRCGAVSLLCEEHYIHLNNPQRAGKMRCSKCKAESYKYTELYFCVHKI